MPDEQWPPYEDPGDELEPTMIRETLNNDASAQGSVTGRKLSPVRRHLGGGEYPMFTAPQCLTCQCERRDEIERAILDGASYRSIADSLPPMRILGKEIKLTPKHIQRHKANGHLPLEIFQRRAILDQRIAEMGASIEEYQDATIDHTVALKEVVRRGFSSMNQGDIRPSMADTIRAARALASIEATGNGEGGGGGVALDDVETAFATLREVIESVAIDLEAGDIPVRAQEIMRQVSIRSTTNPILKALQEKITGAPPPEVLV